MTIETCYRVRCAGDEMLRCSGPEAEARDTPQNACLWALEHGWFTPENEWDKWVCPEHRHLHETN